MAYAARLVTKIHPAATSRAEPRRLSSRRVGALSGTTTVKQQKFVAKSAISAVEDGDAFVGVKQNTRPIIVIDNYDSFTYNLCQYMGEAGANFEVYRNDEITVEEIKKISPRGILISPGPGKVVRSPYGVVHGKGSLVHYNEKLDGTLFSDLPNPFQAGRYHSLVIEKDSFPHDTLEIVAWTDDGLIMAARHRIYKHVQGVQFHPESIVTTEGRLMVKNFIKIIEDYEALNCAP
ncbi:anthranilate synthase beta subunit 2, chloroplastic-like isoform X2 [Miscanthus floridulus]|uniref:anthranilate synthase beta subunit 2, chloroplastic-like isoform X2 n=1 Tax=Miscanthus floridulus TaxID=154761 RepID=UPI0034593891